MADSAEGLARIAAAFVRRGVNFVAIGGWAVQAQGFDLGYETEDIDFTPDLGQDNLERIVKALEDLEAQTMYRGLVLDILPDAQGLARTTVWTMTCPHGNFDLVFDPAGLDGYQQLLRTAHPVSINAGGQRIVDAADPVEPHEALHAFAVHTLALPAQLCGDPRRPAGPAGAGVDLFDRPDELGLGQLCG